MKALVAIGAGVEEYVAFEVDEVDVLAEIDVSNLYVAAAEVNTNTANPFVADAAVDDSDKMIASMESLQFTGHLSGCSNWDDIGNSD